MLLVSSIVTYSWGQQQSKQPDAQTLRAEINLKEPYYIDVNQANNSVVYEVRNNVMGIVFNDGIGQSKDIRLEIIKWNSKVVGNFVLDKIPGQNQYTIDMANLNEPFEAKGTYTCKMTDEVGNRYLWYISNAVNKKMEIDASIEIKTVALRCGEEFGNLVEFYSVVKNAATPYSVSWYVLDEAKADFLSQPKNEIVLEKGKTSMIEVDDRPSYYVVMDVTDACGNNTKKMVYITCEEGKKKIHSIFVEPLKNNTLPQRNGKEN
jgi:hypothetical protein